MIRPGDVKAIVRASLAAALIWLVYFLRGNIYLRLYPAVVSAAAFAAFAISSFRTPLVETIARKRGEKLDAAGVRYCRRVNNCWTAFLGLHLAVTVASVFMSHEFWAFYNGFLAYVLFAAMFAAEWLVRRKLKGRV
jgi:uncharacterized membrane protein